jgi:hypothetical protein
LTHVSSFNRKKTRNGIPVHLPDGKTAERNAWKVQSGEELAFRAMEQRLSRSGVKETTLDYTKDFAERRGIAEHLASEARSILLLPKSLAKNSPPVRPIRNGRIRIAQQCVPPRRSGPPCRPILRRSRFAGLKFSRGTAVETPSVEQSAQQAWEPAQSIDKPKRGMFAGLKLNAASRDREPAERRDVPQSPEAWRPLSGFEQAVDRYARAFTAAARMQDQGLPILASQKSELQAAKV